MKAYITISTDRERIYGIGATVEQAEADALRWTNSLSETTTIYAEVSADHWHEVQGHTAFTEVENPRAEFAAIRRALGWSQADTAKALDRSLSWVRRVEQGQIPCPSYAVYAMRWLQHQHHTSAP